MEKFLPEIEDDLYHIRVHVFLGDHWTCTRLGSANPIVKYGTSMRAEAITPPEEVLQRREKLKLDYGKIDHMIHGGNVIILDANKTDGAPPPSDGFSYLSRETLHS